MRSCLDIFAFRRNCRVQSLDPQYLEYSTSAVLCNTVYRVERCLKLISEVSRATNVEKMENNVMIMNNWQQMQGVNHWQQGQVVNQQPVQEAPTSHRFDGVQHSSLCQRRISCVDFEPSVIQTLLDRTINWIQPSRRDISWGSNYIRLRTA